MHRALIALGLLGLAGCGEVGQSRAEARDAGPRVARDFPAGAFSKVALLGPDDVAVVTGPVAKVRAEGDQRAIDTLRIEIVDGELRIARTRDDGAHDRGKAKVTVTTPGIVAARLGGAGDFSIDRVAQGRFDASVSGAGDMTIGALQAERASFSLGGAGAIAAKGRARTLALWLSGAGRIDARELAAERVTIRNAGTGSIRANARTTADITLSGVGSVTVDGNPACTVKKTGVGEVECG